MAAFCYQSPGLYRGNSVIVSRNYQFKGNCTLRRSSAQIRACLGGADKDFGLEPRVAKLLDSVKWDDKGLAVAIAQNIDTGDILMQGFVNKEALGTTVSSRKATFYSRSRSQLWTKGETSMNFINVHDPIIVIDNYDSFTYNLCQYMGELGCLFEVYRNDELSVDELKRKNPRGVLISPGPGTPQDSGISLQTVLELGPTVPLFGVCMGLQCIGEAFGGKIVRSPNGVMHGKSSPVFYDEKGHDGLFAGLSNPFTAGRYHSLVIEKDSFPSEELEVTAWTEDGLIMAARHKKYKHLQGVQFHPESIITEEGKTIVRNFIKMVEKHNAN